MVTTTSRAWGWLLGMGILLIILGFFAISSPFAATFASVLALGWLLVIGGVIQLISAFSVRRSNGFVIYALLALFYILVGILMIINPTVTALTLTMLLAIFFLTLGVFRIFSSIAVHYANWIWFLISGILSLVLGILILAHWPSSALWVIGLFIGIDFLFAGWSLLGMSFIAKKVGI